LKKERVSPPPPPPPVSPTRLIVEAEGDSHVGGEEKDGRRRDFLELQGLKVPRFWNVTVFDEQDSFVETLDRECVARVSHVPNFAGRMDEWGQLRKRTSRDDDPD
jgi:Protein of unknown function (DUF559)